MVAEFQNCLPHTATDRPTTAHQATTRRLSNMQSLPLLTDDLPGIGGRIKQFPLDFEVEEIPAYQPSGQGEHLFLWIEKRDTAAEQLTRHLSRVLGISTRDIGVAGLKDRQAVTRQFVSVPASCEDELSAVETGDIRLLESARHENKLRTGHLQGNRFSLLVRETAGDAYQRAQLIGERISRRGFPNFYGSQRFGVENETLRMGADLLTGKRTPGDFSRSRSRFLLRLALSAVQSDLFNRALAERMSDGLLHRVLAGDVMQVVASGGKFLVEDTRTEQRRFDERQIVTTGPMFGIKMRRPVGDVLQREIRLLEQSGFGLSDFRRFKRLVPGTRRPYLIWPAEFSISEETEGIRFRFVLPRGAYATVLLREFLKKDEARVV